ncbi:MAG: hypothetical protein CMP81_13345 [Fulvimarina sp.]|nr:hypothetical protein [Fulvimarina sp.]
MMPARATKGASSSSTKPWSMSRFWSASVFQSLGLARLRRCDAFDACPIVPWIARGVRAPPAILPATCLTMTFVTIFGPILVTTMLATVFLMNFRASDFATILKPRRTRCSASLSAVDCGSRAIQSKTTIVITDMMMPRFSKAAFISPQIRLLSAKFSRCRSLPRRPTSSIVRRLP